ncbi:uncharacterized protein EKO05_0006065 [Ascochyta rabiei]|uniref:Uncharacterized protein n=1 Tax=Didymella rabiei TaxID=5454 RepID=A0A163IDA1_DIDRA|nr:uncharacterized protein EKO05_0006065 [Ascochyta rabiei]KZM25713.1 hypothetical protein ST47_g3133 [Ascochyta rabiei]UPX15622.1 hypothetical protein EKO05_0006065 [Ascochyta rabiei]
MSSAAVLTALPKSKANTEHGPTLASKPSGDAAAAYHNEATIRDNPYFEHPDQIEASGSKYNQGIENLVIVCCHAIFHPDVEAPDFPTHNPHDESNWYLAPFQSYDQTSGKPGEHETFLTHIQAGLDIMTTGANATWKEDVPWNQDSTILIFSGGATKQSLTSLSEARSYYHAALAQELCQGHIGGGRAHQLYSKGRILLEEDATDSLQNLLFSILLFRRTIGQYPKNIRIITHAFKSKRFLELHAPAIHWPRDRIQIQGIDPVMSSAEIESTLQGEEKFGYAPWTQDPLGTEEVLSRKRKQRGWNEQQVKDLTDGLEESVKTLLIGEASEDLPWAKMPKREVKTISGPPPLRY